jgi:hypothetical protein
MSYRADRDHANRWQQAHTEAKADALQEWNLSQRTSSSRKDFSIAYNALVTAINHAKQAAPDFLHQVPTDEAAAMILSRWAPSTGVSY